MRNDDVFFMRRCLELAEKGRGYTGINPMVGAVLVRDGLVIAEGFHAAFGKAHAERDLLEKFEQKIRSTDVMYVSLEPCCHTKKKTPPCAQLLLERGVKNLVYGMKDPNPEVAGKGIALLRDAGVRIGGPVLQAECRRQNRDFVSLMTNGRPWITLKQARMRDGRLMNADGSPLKITDATQDAWSHRFLRARHDAILVGVGTVESDDPSLTVRHAGIAHPLTAIILDPALRVAETANIIRPGTIIVTGDASSEKAHALGLKGVRIAEVRSENGCFSWSDLWEDLCRPSDQFFGISSILVEGGPTVWKHFRESGVVDEEVVLLGHL